MLTGLHPPTEGEALLFGAPLYARGMSARYRVGYMSQSFSLCTELTVRQNLDLHARLFHLALQKAKARVDELVEWFGFEDYLDQPAADVPLGVRQRLSLAVALVHEPDLLILDEPTSGVDPLARDRFWEALIDLSRKKGVTIFVSTHFMNEAERCDRVALMDSGRVLAAGAPAELVKARRAATLAEAFVSYLRGGDGAAGLPRDRRSGGGGSLSAQAARQLRCPACQFAAPVRLHDPRGARAIPRSDPTGVQPVWRLKTFPTSTRARASFRERVDRPSRRLVHCRAAREAGDRRHSGNGVLSDRGLPGRPAPARCAHAAEPVIPRRLGLAAALPRDRRDLLVAVLSPEARGRGPSSKDTRVGNRLPRMG